jgi:hypothetical protein
MPGIHIGGSFHGTFHPTATGALPPERSNASGFAQPGALTASSDRVAGPPAVLRLRGGGNSQGSQAKGGDRERLVPEQTGARSHGMYRGTQSTSETQRAANEMKRYEFGAKLDQATRERDAARAGLERANADLESTTAAMKDLLAEKERGGAEPARLREIERQLKSAHADFVRKTGAVSRGKEELRKSEDKCCGLERRLDKLRLT